MSLRKHGLERLARIWFGGECFYPGFPGYTWLWLVARIVVRVGRNYAVYLPKRVVEELKLKEGEKLILTVEGQSIVLRRPLDFFEEIRRSPKRLRLTPEEFEKTSVEAQEEHMGLSDAQAAT
ncbi:MAG: AbrB/MazE/SpoVT family DNA-binding domain-containing protein [Thermofilum sp.]